MKNGIFHLIVSVAAILFVFAALPSAQELKTVALPAPQLDSSKSLIQALKDRKSSRAFSPDTLSLQTISNLLWAAFGVNRPQTGGRTAPSAMNWQEVDIYVAKADGLFLYDAKGNALKQILSADIRGATGQQPFVKNAPVNLVYVADQSKMSRASGEDKAIFSGADVGFIGQNVYLYCASAGLATVIRGSIDKPALAKTMKLRADQKIILSQTIGYPK